jgi:hypothetical protein
MTHHRMKWIKMCFTIWVKISYKQNLTILQCIIKIKNYVTKNNYLFKTLIMLGKKLLPNLLVLHLKEENCSKFLKLYPCSFYLVRVRWHDGRPPITKSFSLFSHKVYFDVYPAYRALQHFLRFIVRSVWQ